MSNLKNERRRWRRHFERVRAEQLDFLVRQRDIFKIFQGTVRSARMPKHSSALYITNWMALNYMVFASVWTRKVGEEARQSEKKARSRARPVRRKRRKSGDQRSISLVRLLEDVADEPDAITFDRFRRAFSATNSAIPKRIVRAQWDRHANGNDKLSESDIRRDIAAVKRATALVEKFVDKEIAHTARSRLRNSGMSFGMIHDAVDVILNTAAKYELLMFGSAVPQEDLTGEYEDLERMFSALWRAAKS